MAGLRAERADHIRWSYFDATKWSTATWWGVIFAAYCILANLGAVYGREIAFPLTFAVSGYTYSDQDVWPGIEDAIDAQTAEQLPDITIVPQWGENLEL